MTKVSPIFNQYKKLKEKHSDAILLFRLGDFYEMFLEDAYKASKLLNLTLTSKPMGKDLRVPMCGIPVKSANVYIKKLLGFGLKIAIAEQMDEMESKNLMKREVVEVLTPGTIIDEDFLSESENNYIGSLYKSHQNAGLVLLDISTGELIVYEDNITKILEFIGKIDIRELLIPENYELNLEDIHIVRFPQSEYDYLTNSEIFRDFFNKEPSAYFGMKVPSLAIRSLGVLIKYLKQNKPNALSHIKVIKVGNLGIHLNIDKQTLRNLEIFESIRADARGKSLFNVLNKTKTPIGSRALKKALTNPYTSLEKINKRLNRIEALIVLKEKLEETQKILELIGDPERKLGKISVNRITPIELFKFALSIKNWNDIYNILGNLEPFMEFFKNINTLNEIANEILRTLSDNPPYSISEGNTIREGINPEIDKLRKLLIESEKLISEIETTEKERTKIPTLRIGYNEVYGYYIEITKSHKDKVPSDWEGVQTLVNTLRFKNKKLVEIEKDILYAKEKILNLEKEILNELRKKVLSRSREIRLFFEYLGEIDLNCAIARISIENNYIRPQFNDDGIVEIVEGRHPVIEALNKEFVPNSLYLDNENNAIILTGPNMSGKSTFLRQNAIIVLMAHAGFFVPARKANIHIVDRIFSRVGASDDISSGISTFMAEMIETAYILNNATSNSFIILDEVGRGTSTYDGISIARAIIEYIQNYIKSKTIFATHYYELVKLEKEVKGIKNYCMEVKEIDGNPIFTRKVIRGSSDRSYGIYVAKLAGIPEWVINRASELLLNSKLENYHIELDINPDEITPKQALEILYKIFKKT
ncbi:MAG: DNA mismatch repair protein MutS [candidate division WOR-3 bacterium]|nr:DNA mismatch repair protein MutS [candidate division WOR-3 bacterium]